MDLDYDDSLGEDKELFGIEEPLPEVPMEVAKPASQPTCTIKDAVQVAQAVFGLTNSETSDEFYMWARNYLNEGTLPNEELLSALRREKNYWGPRAYLCRRMAKPYIHLERRWNAVACAILTVRAVQAIAQGLSGLAWIERLLYRASLAEGDDKASGLGRGSGKSTFRKLQT